MTLIELLVVIVILTTLVAGVLPLVSPNNEGRKIQEASRGLQTYFMMAQAEAARLGRPVGVGFIESAEGSGVALEAFQLVVPPPYPGPSTSSRVRLFQEFVSVLGTTQLATYGDTDNNPTGNDGSQFNDRYKGFPLYRVQFVSQPVTKGELIGQKLELFPPNMLRIGDVLDIEGNDFLIVDNPQDSDYLTDRDTGFLLANSRVYCVWMNSAGQQWPAFSQDDAGGQVTEPGPNRSYLAMRQPSQDNRVGVSSSSAYQFPTGVALDLQASGIEGVAEPVTVAASVDQTKSVPPPSLRQLGLLFSPTGGIDSVWFNGAQIYDVARIFLLLGRVENGSPDFSSYRFRSATSNEELAEQRKAVNWLNLDSRWMMINAHSGKYNMVENASFDPRPYPQGAIRYEFPDGADYVRLTQIEAAHELAHHHGD